MEPVLTRCGEARQKGRPACLNPFSLYALLPGYWAAVPPQAATL